VSEGPAALYTEARSVDDLRGLLAWARSRSVRTCILGGGSNVVVEDVGFDGLVVRIASRGIDLGSYGGRPVVTVAAGEPWDDLVAWCVARGLAGVECLSGIPGLVGAAPIQNVGAYGQEVAETIVALDALRVSDGTMRRFSNSECRFSYRDSVFKREARGEWVVTAVAFALRDGGEPAVRYPDLRRQLDEAGVDRPSLADVRQAVIAVRAAKGMVVDPADPDSRSAGSFFTNPVLPDEDMPFVLRRVEAALGPSTAESMPRWAGADGRTKLSAAWLIERAGFCRGFVRGRAGTSTKHALAIVNRGGATAREILGLATEIRDGVERIFGVRLEMEPVVVGDA
jgi:UDP-N-acetylmuramate dehydrogenase